MGRKMVSLQQQQQQQNQNLEALFKYLPIRPSYLATTTTSNLGEKAFPCIQVSISFPFIILSFYVKNDE
jgi:hypothetical protein